MMNYDKLCDNFDNYGSVGHTLDTGSSTAASKMEQEQKENKQNPNGRFQFMKMVSLSDFKMTFFSI